MTEMFQALQRKFPRPSISVESFIIFEECQYLLQRDNVKIFQKISDLLSTYRLIAASWIELINKEWGNQIRIMTDNGNRIFQSDPLVCFTLLKK